MVDSTPVFQWQFSNYSDANLFLQKHGKYLTPYESNRWINRQKEFLNKASHGILPRESTLVTYLTSNNCSSLLEIGGGSGWLFEYGIKNDILPADFRFYILELPLVCDYFQRLHEDSRLKYLKSLEDLNSQEVEVIYANSVFQYLPNLDSLIEIMDKFKPSKLIIDEFPLSSTDYFVSAQKYYDDFLVVTFHTMLMFEELLESMNYRIESVVETSPQISNLFSWEITLDEFSRIKAPPMYNFKIVKKN